MSGSGRAPLPGGRGARIAVVAGLAGLAALLVYAQVLRGDAWMPPGPPEEAGRVLMERKRCVRCHQIAGVGGLVGPDLTVVALKRRAAWLDAYLQDPKAIHPDGKMPKPNLTAAQRAAVVAYLATLDGSAPPVPPGARPSR